MMRTLQTFCVFLLLFAGRNSHAATVAAVTNDTATVALAAGEVHGLALRSDGTVWAWGTNRVGELGLGNVAQFNSPRRITSLTSIAGISAGPLHSLAVGANGVVWAWGTNNNGQLGNATTTTTNAPAQTTRITNGLAVSAGVNHSLAVLQDGRVMAWGANVGGQLGTGNTVTTNQPVAAGSFTNVIMAAAGANFSLALTAAGEVWSWGTNAQGQLGLGNNTTQLSPVKISTLSNIVQIAAGSAHVLARDTSGNVYAWGTNANGQLGVGTTVSTNAPQIVTPAVLGAAKWIAAGFNSSAAVTANGKLCYWGNYTNNAVFFGNANAPVQIGVAVDETFNRVTLGLNFVLGRSTDGAAVWGWGLNQYAQWGNDNPQIDDWRYEAVNQSFCFSARPTPIVDRFLRGDRLNLPYNSFVLPLDLEQGVRINAEGSEQYCYSSGAPWFMKVQKSTRQHVFQLAGATTNVTRFPVENPIAAYGREAGGSPLYAGQPYTFGVYAGAFNENLTATNAIRVLVYDRAALAGGTNNVAPTNVFTIGLPRRNIAADDTAWSNYVTNGNRILIETNGLRTSVEFSDNLNNSLNNDSQNWGVYWKFGTAPANVILGGYRITHSATSTNYCYIVEVQGQAQVDGNVWAPMAVTNTTTWSYSPMYALGFESGSPWRAQFLDSPVFEGIPLPPAYAGRRVAELNGMQAVVTNNFVLTNNAAYATLDASPELRRHPVLDQFVQDMGRNPLALASYVLNEIELTDPLGYREASGRVNDSIEIGGVNRSALGTFLEGQGSPTEQCALLIYLLRQSGYSAGYVFPTNNNLRLLDTTVSRLWQINVKGAVFHAGVPVITNSLIAANYPWVAVNVGTNCYHIFPWMKNTEIVEGPDIYDYMPTNYSKAYQFVKDYALATPSVLGGISPNEPMINIWKQFLTGIINTNTTARNLALDDFGARAFNRRDSYTSWDQFPRPNFVTNQSQLVTVPTLSESAVTYPFLTNMFDRVRVEIFKTDTNTANRIFDTGLWRACDFHNRKFLVYSNSTTVTLWLAPYRPDTTNTVSDFTNFETGTNSLNKQVVNATVAGGVSDLPVRVSYVRRVGTLASVGSWYPTVIESTSGTLAPTTALKRDVTALIPWVGRVSQAMLRQHADDYWKLEQQRALNPNFTPAITDDAGTTAMLLASGFFQKVWADDQFNQRLHKVHGLTWNSSGTAALTRVSQPDADYMQIKLGMNWFGIQVLGNARNQQDSSDRSLQSLDNYLTALQAIGASSEHTIIHSMFQDDNSVSSIRLLQLAAERNRTNGYAAPLELNIKNYAALGNVNYTGYGSTLLKNLDANFWLRVTNVFGTPVEKDFTRVLVTPGKVSSGDSFTGLAALIFGRTQTGALVSANDVVLNGGFSSFFAWLSPPSFSTYQLTYSLNYNASAGYSFTPNNFGTAQPHYTFSTYDALTLTSTGAVKVAFTPQQSVQSDYLLGTYNLGPGATTGQAIKAAKDVGWWDRAKAWSSQAGSFVSDPVNVVSGDFYVDTVDLALAGPLPLQVRRNYQSATLADNQFGPGWKLGFTPWLVLSTNAQSQSLIYSAEPDGAVLAYRFQSNNLWTVTAENNPSLVNFTPGGIGSTANLFQNRIQKYTTNGNTYVLSGVDGSKRTYQEMTGFGLSTGTNYLNRIRPYLTRWEDHAGNYHLFYYGTNSASTDFGQLYRVESANGGVLTLKYDVNSRITEAITDDDRHVRYEYDTYGDLVRVILPDNSLWEYEYQKYTFTTNTTTYTDSNHLLVKETKPNGRIIANTYDAYRRVLTQAATVGTNRELVTNAWFFYTNNVASLTNEYVSGTTGVRDVFQNAYLYTYTSNLITRIDEPTGRVKIQDWFDGSETNKTGYYQRSLEKTTDPRSLVTEFLYSTNGNVTSRTVRGNLTGEGSTNQTSTVTLTYNTNQLALTAIDPSGNQRLAVYDDTNDLYRATRIEWSNGGTGIATNRFSYTNVSETVTLGLLSKTNRAYGLLAREIRADTSTNDWSYNGRGFVIQSTRYAKTAEDSGNTDPAVVNTFAFTARGDLADRYDAAGRRLHLNYDTMGRLQWRDVSDETGASLSRENFYYNRNGELEWYDGPRSGPEDYQWFSYDGAGRLVQETSWRSRAKSDGSGVEAETGDNLYAIANYRYDGFGNQILSVDPRGAITTNSWDALGQLVQQKAFDLDGSTVLSTVGFAYEPGGLVRYQTNALGGISEVQYTSGGQPNFRRNADGSTNGWTYYLDGRAKREFQGNGAYSETTYNDASRSVTRIFYAAGGTALATNLVEFDRRGYPVRSTDAAFNTFTNSFDGLGRLKWTAGPKLTFDPAPGSPGVPGGTGPAPVQQTFTNYYDDAGILTTNINALGEKSIVQRDALNRVVRTEIRTAANALVRESSVVYAADHQSATVTTGSGANAITTTTYTDNEGQTVLSVGYPFGGEQEFSLFTYDVGGNLLSEGRYAAVNNSVSFFAGAGYAYDGLARVTSQYDRDNALTTYGYDPMGNVTNRVMPGGLAWQGVFNNAGQLTFERNAGAGSTFTRTNSYAYFTSGALKGLLSTRTDGRGLVCSVGYDDYLRVTTNSYAGTLAEQNLTTTWQYDPRGYVTGINQSYATTNPGPATAITRDYDPYGMMSTESVVYGGDGYTSASNWDSAGRRSSLGFGSFGYSYAWKADGRLSVAATPAGNSSYAYDTSGFLTNRVVGPRTTSLLARDGRGRPTSLTTKINGSPIVNETLDYTGDGLIGFHTVERPDFTDSRSYFYASLSRRLVEERLNLNGSTRWTNTFAFDGGTASGPGVLTRLGQPQGGGSAWTGGKDSFLRTSTETNNVIRRATYGLVNGPAVVTAKLDGVPMPVTLVGTNGGQWRATLELTPGTHSLTASAVHPSGQFTTNVTHSFTNTASPQTATAAYDTAGQLTQRVWKNASGTTNRMQTLAWNALGQLVKVTERDSGNNGRDFVAIYDPLGRRVQTVEFAVTNNVAFTGQPKVITAYYDPLAEFQELGVNVDGMITWKLLGPDLNGTYGGLNGLGGLDAIVSEPNVFQPVISDARGNLLASYDINAVTYAWNPARPTAFGAVPGFRPAPLGQGASLVQSSAWRGRWLDSVGSYNIGERPYSPENGMWLSFDSAWNGMDPTGYGAFGGDGVNYFDPSGRMGKNWLDTANTLRDSNESTVGDRFAAMGFGLGGTILSIPRALDQTFQGASLGMANARAEINTYEGGQALLARTLMLPADFAYGTTKLVNQPIDTVSGLPQGFVNFGGKIGNDVYNVGVNPSINTGFDMIEDAVSVFSLTTGTARGLTASGVTAPLENFAAKTYLKYVDPVNGASLYNSFAPGTARLNVGFGGKTLYRAADNARAASGGRFAAVELPSSPAQAIQQNALAPQFGNTASQLFRVTTRPGFNVQGIVASQGVGFEGGVTQVFQNRPPATVTVPRPSPWSSVQQIPYPH